MDLFRFGKGSSVADDAAAPGGEIRRDGLPADFVQGLVSHAPVDRMLDMAEARLAADRPDHLYFRQLLAVLLDFLAATASPTA